MHQISAVCRQIFHSCRCDNSLCSHIQHLSDTLCLCLNVGCRRISLDSVPTDTDEACAEWLHAHFREKVADCFIFCS